MRLGRIGVLGFLIGMLALFLLLMVFSESTGPKNSGTKVNEHSQEAEDDDEGFETWEDYEKMKKEQDESGCNKVKKKCSKKKPSLEDESGVFIL